MTVAASDGRTDRRGDLHHYGAGGRHTPPPPTNRAPSVTNPGNKTVTAGQSLSFTISGSDPDAGNTLRFAATGLPSGASLNATTGAFAWTPTTAQASATPYSVTVTATDNGTPPLTSAAQSFTITVQAVVAAPPPTTNQAPTVTNPGNRTVTAGSPLSFMITGTDPNVGQTRTFSAGTTLPAGATLSATGAFAWTPTTAQASATPYSVTVTATDNGTPPLTSAAQTFTITVQAVVAPPPPTGGGALSISSFRATEEVHVGEQVRVRLTVRYAGTANASAPAHVVGIQNGVKVYDRTMTVSIVGTTASTFAFPSYTPKARGDIKWTVTVGTGMAGDTTQVEGRSRSTRRNRRED